MEITNQGVVVDWMCANYHMAVISNVGWYEAMNPAALVEMANAVFAKDAASTPRITLRGGDALDGYKNPPPFDPALDEVTDTYLEHYSGGLTFLDVGEEIGTF